MRLGDYITIVGGGTPSKENATYWDGNIPWASVKDFKADVICSTEDFITQSGVENSSTRLIPAGNLLIATRMAVGKVAFNEVELAINQDLKAIYCNTEVDKNFLFYLLKSKSNYFNNIATGATVKGIKINHITDIQIPLPALSTQKKIAAILDEADKLRQLNKQLIQKYEALTQSLFLEMFGDPVTNPKRWETTNITELVAKDKWALKRGPFGGALKKEIFVDKGYLVYEQFHALNNDFSFARYYINEGKFQELKAFEVKPKDIIISCSGVYLGKLAVIPENAKPGIINQALLKVTLDEDKMRNVFFVFHFTQKNFRETFFNANRGAGIPNFPPMTDFKRFPFILPPIHLQDQFAERVQAIGAQKAQAQQALVKSEELFNGLLQRAFKGELVKE
ncbi:MAG: restriction endonuclease subunit S [Marinilabiliaceae bacterium]|nr:restriction endonuclease subunit S [Marinilabiliaceae bacterium]